MITLVGELCDTYSTSDPDRHAGLKPAPIALRIEAQPERVEIVVSDCALGPARSRRSPIGRTSVTTAGAVPGVPGARDLDRRPDCQAVQLILTHVE